MAVIEGGVSGNLTEVDSNNNCKVNLPTTASQAGFQRQTFVPVSTDTREARIMQSGELYSTVGNRLFMCDFNGAAAGALFNNQWNQQATTMATALNGGFLRFNSGAITTINTGVSVNTWTVFNVQNGSALRLKGRIRHTQGAVSNKQFDFGFGYYDVAANQSAVMNEFIGFRWTQSGALIGVLEYTVGGAPTSVTVNLNGGIPYSDSVAREYEVVITNNQVEFWMNNTYLGVIVTQPDAAGAFKSNGQCVIARLFNGASAPALAPVFDLGVVSVESIGVDTDLPVATMRSLTGRSIINNQAGIQGVSGSPVVVPASGTAPTAATGSNTATVSTGMGGFYRINGASVIVTTHSNIIVSSFQNPAIPETAGAATDARPFVVTDIFISPMVVSTVLVGGGAAWLWFVAVGSTALSLATGDAIGGAAIGTKSPRYLPLPTMDSVGAAAALGTVLTRAGDSSFSLATPLVVNPGEFIHFGIRAPFVTAAITSGTIDGSIGLSGYYV